MTATWTTPSALPLPQLSPPSGQSTDLANNVQDSVLSIDPHSIYGSTPFPKETDTDSRSSCSDTPPNFLDDIQNDAKLDYTYNPLSAPLEPLVLSSAAGLLITPRPTDSDQTYMQVSWTSLVQFLTNPANVGSLPFRHPIRLVSKMLQEQGMDNLRDSPAYTRACEPAYSWAPPPMSAIGFYPHMPSLQHSSSESQVPRIINTSFHQRTPSSHSVRSAPYTLSARSPRNSSSPSHNNSGSPTQIGLAKPVSYNQQDDHYIFSMVDNRLYRMGAEESKNAMGRPDSVYITFPAGSAREAREKDGARAIPAWTSTWPSSNEFLKAQICGHNCIYARGFGNKRPVLIREHFRKCQHLPDDHPMKVLSKLELEAHARMQFGERSLKRKRQDLTVSTSSSAVSSDTRVSGSAGPLSRAYTPSSTITIQQPQPRAPNTANPLLQQFQEYRSEILTPAVSSASSAYLPLPSASSINFSPCPPLEPPTTGLPGVDFDIMSLLDSSTA